MDMTKEEIELLQDLLGLRLDQLNKGASECRQNEQELVRSLLRKTTEYSNIKS